MKKILSCFTVTVLFALPNVVFAAPKTIALDVPGMTCSLCPVTVKKSLTRVQGVSKVDVSLEKKVAVVTFDDSKTTVQVLTESTGKAGFPSTLKQ